MNRIELDSVLVLAGLVVLSMLYVGLVTIRGRRLLGRPGGVSLVLRIDDDPWRVGVGRYAGDELLWYGAFRPARGPTMALRRGDLEVIGQRRRRATEPVVPADSVIVECRSMDSRVSLGLSEAAVTGFLSWLEASAPR